MGCPSHVGVKVPRTTQCIRQIGNLKKRLQIGREGVYEENSDFRGKKTNRIDQKYKVY